MIRALAIVLACACTGGVVSPSPSPTPSPGVGPASSPLPAPPTDFADAPPVPSGAVTAVTSAPVPSPPPPSTPTPTPDPLIWRFEGRVVDADGDPLRDVCVAIGPRGCQRFSPHTDERGVYFFDVPQVPTVVYDLYFEKDGYTIVWYRAQPNAPTVFNVLLQKRQSRAGHTVG